MTQMRKITDRLTEKVQVIEHPQVTGAVALAQVDRMGRITWTGMTADEMDALALELLAASARQRERKA